MIDKHNVKIFISYAREDWDFAIKIYNNLKSEGFSPWIDREELLPGQNWRKVIEKAIQESSYVLAVCSSNSVSKRGFVQKELKIAIDLLDEFPPAKIFIIPVKIDECEPLHDELKLLHCVDLFPDYEKGFEKVFKTLMPYKSIPQGENRTETEKNRLGVGSPS